MDITEITVKLVKPRVTPDGGVDDKLLGFVNVVFDDAFLVHGIKLIRGTKGDIFLAMPDKRVEDACFLCANTNGLRDRYCRCCGVRLADDRGDRGPTGKVKHFVDIFHPVSAASREWLHDHVMEAYHDEVEAAKARALAATAPLAARMQAHQEVA